MGARERAYSPPSVMRRLREIGLPDIREISQTARLFATALGSFLLLRIATDYVAEFNPDLIYVWCALIALITAALAGVAYDALPVFGVRFVRASAIFLVIYFLVEPFYIPAANGAEYPEALHFHEVARWIGLALALLGLVRPAAVFAGAATLWMVRGMQTELTGFYFSTLDIRNIAEVGSFVSLGILLIITLQGRLQLKKGAAALRKTEVERLCLMVVAAGMGGHLANYFYSALAKLSLDGGVFSWILHNHLQAGLLGALEKGTMPLAAFPDLTQFVYNALASSNLLINVVAFSVQLFAVIASRRRTWAIAAIVAYDVFHLAVYLVFGLLFWKWIALNTIIIATLMTIRDDQWRRQARNVCTVFVFVAPLFFKTATLAWYDTPGFASEFFEARLDDGRIMRIPSAYFGSASYQVSQGQFFYPANHKHFDFTIWGSVLHWKELVDGRECRIPRTHVQPNKTYGSLQELSRYVAAHHRYVLNNVDRRGVFDYYLYPHHHVPSPFVKDPFYLVDKRDIRAYYYVIESVCLSLHDGKLQRRVMARSEYPVYQVPR